MNKSIANKSHFLFCFCVDATFILLIAKKKNIQN